MSEIEPCIYCDPRGKGPKVFFKGISRHGHLCKNCRLHEIELEIQSEVEKDVDRLERREGIIVSRMHVKLCVALKMLSYPIFNYDIIRNVFTNEQCNRIKSLQGSAAIEKISFDGEKKRFQQTIFQNWQATYNCQRFPVFLQEFMINFMIFHKKTKYYTMKLLHSEAGCGEQLLHSDDATFTNSKDQFKYHYPSFSMIIALEPDNNPTTVMVKVESEVRECVLYQGDMLLMRCDCFHAGAAYNQTNYRLFIGTGTVEFENAGTWIEKIIVRERKRKNSAAHTIG